MKRKTLNYLILLALPVYFITFSALAENICADPVLTRPGPVRGKPEAAGKVCAYLAIPYAAPPVGDLRWKAPQDHAPWTEVLDATTMGPECCQKALVSFRSRIKGREDCLHLNIYRPARPGKFPVMIWIHGGSLVFGSNASPMYQGDRMAAGEDVVMVVINYRLGPFGFLSHPEFAGEDPHGSAGNYGTLDQIKALEWVRDNIAQFSGDPQNVTIFGESAGGWSVCTLLASPPARGLFHRAIIESGSCWESPSAQEGYDFGKVAAAQLGCTGEKQAPCMRAKSAEEIMSGITPITVNSDISKFKPHIDGYVLEQKPVYALRSGDYNKVPLLIGTNRNELQVLALLGNGSVFMSDEKYKQVLAGKYTYFADQIYQLYPTQKYGEPWLAYGAVETDRQQGCDNYSAVQALALKSAPVYYYRFDYDADIYLSQYIGAFHSLEIPFVMGTLDRKPLSYIFKNDDLATENALSREMMAYWTNFARTGNPNGEGLTEWPIFDMKTRQRMIFNTPALKTETDESEEKCNLWMIIYEK